MRLLWRPVDVDIHLHLNGNHMEGKPEKAVADFPGLV